MRPDTMRIERACPARSVPPGFFFGHVMYRPACIANQSDVISSLMSAPIASPNRTADISDRLLECEEALERSFQDLVERAERAGWDTIEITVALQSLADHHMLMKAADAGTDAMIEFANERRRMLKGD